MNIFRFAGDMSHLASLVFLYHKITVTRSCKGAHSQLHFESSSGSSPRNCCSAGLGSSAQDNSHPARISQDISRNRASTIRTTQFVVPYSCIFTLLALTWTLWNQDELLQQHLEDQLFPNPRFSHLLLAENSTPLLC